MRKMSGYNGVARRIMARNDEQIGTLMQVGDEFTSRKLFKQNMIDCLVCMKIICDRLDRNYYSWQLIDYQDFKESALLYGFATYDVLMRMENHGIRLTKNEYQTLFNLSEKDWKEAKINPAKPLDVAAVQTYSDTALTRFMDMYMLHQIRKNSKLNQRMKWKLQYDFGFNFIK